VLNYYNKRSVKSQAFFYYFFVFPIYPVFTESGCGILWKRLCLSKKGAKHRRICCKMRFAIGTNLVETLLFLWYNTILREYANQKEFFF